MIVKKCDICGAEMRMKEPRYKVIYNGLFYTQKMDVCTKCFDRITEEIKQADTPQTEHMKTADYCDICKQDMCEFCTADGSNPYCVPSHYEIKQTEKADCIPFDPLVEMDIKRKVEERLKQVEKKK